MGKEAKSWDRDILAEKVQKEKELLVSFRSRGGKRLIREERCLSVRTRTHKRQGRIVGCKNNVDNYFLKH